ncbi:MAG TPA: glycosyltransferase [Candidatus Woesebacteria bacterium]|nr:glycosyltransferase [Candidatus Woesebacteria bacterium]HNS95005.1 glycosyltransferase [Candidatus Woesebacteria bacterium]
MRADWLIDHLEIVVVGENILLDFHVPEGPLDQTISPHFNFYSAHYGVLLNPTRHNGLKVGALYTSIVVIYDSSYFDAPTYILEHRTKLIPGGRFIFVNLSVEGKAPHLAPLEEGTHLLSGISELEGQSFTYRHNAGGVLSTVHIPNSAKPQYNDLFPNMPKVDILMPTYNRREYLAKAIQSIVDQSYPFWKLHVINDGGTSIEDMIDEFQDARITTHAIEHQGKAGALNHALKQSDSPWIGYMDDDDIVFPNHIEVLLRSAYINKKDFLYSDTFLTKMDADSQKHIFRIVENTLDMSYQDLRYRNLINHKQIIHSRALAEKIGNYDTNLDILIDWDYIKRLAKESEPMHIPLITGEHYLRVRGDDIVSITGLWTSDPGKAARSLSHILCKDPEVLIQIYFGYFEMKQKLTDMNNQRNERISELTAKHDTSHLRHNIKLLFGKMRQILHHWSGEYKISHTS